MKQWETKIVVVIAFVVFFYKSKSKSRSKSIMFFTEVKDKPKDSDADFSSWEQRDAQIISLMLNCTEPNISSNLLYLDTAKEIWNRLQQLYSGNITKIYEVCRQLFDLRQGTHSLAEYFSHSMGICEEMNLHQPITSDVKSIQQQHEDFNDVQFLTGLSPEYEFVHAQILGSPTLPSLPDMFSRLQRAILSNSTSRSASCGVTAPPSSERSALVVN
ncbi:uncharacterized protein LOC132296301 [Cornus florida]|uniref:uncharacterized protein LOC132296301 n=1 Tax=Cornus florida TaxID=4283 RepID=UPI00289C170D|nr:uncharacterized protein LOC132296301 [Cornus florida]